MLTGLAKITPVNHFYRVIWRWHFYAGLLIVPFMLILALTGLIYLFKPQLDSVMYRNLMYVSPSGAALAYTQQLDVIRDAYPAAKLTTFRPSDAANRSAEVGLTAQDGRTLTAFVNPYTGQVLGERDQENNLQAIARKIHGELMIGPVGDYLIELAACWGLVLIFTGLYLWWPRKGASVWGTLLPRLWTRDRKVFWRDLHAVPGFYGSLLVGFLILTGLPWSGFWGDQFAQIWNRYPAQLWNDVPKSTLMTGSLNQNGAHLVPWAAEQVPLPQSSPTEHAQHQGNQNPAAIPADSIAPATAVNLDSVIALAQAKAVPAGFSVSLPTDPEGVYTAALDADDPTQSATLHIDQYSGKVLADVRWQQYGFVPKVVSLGIAVHMGTYFGPLNQLLMLLACLVVIGLSVTGTVLWWQRRPAGQLGVPPMPKNFPLWKGAVVIICGLGVLFPLVGMSLLAVLLLDYLVISRVSFLKQIFH